MVVKKNSTADRNGKTATPQHSNSSPLIYPPNYQAPRNHSSHYDDGFDDGEKVPIKQRLGDISDGVFGFVFDPHVIKFTILLFAGFCIAINLAGYFDLVSQVLNTQLDEFGRQLPVDAPVGQRILSFFLRLPVIGGFVQWLDSLTGGVVAVFGAICVLFIIQALEIAGRFHLYFPDTAENLLYKQNRKRYERPGAHPMARKAYRMATTELATVLRILMIFGFVAYAADIYAMGQARPWTDNVGNPLGINVLWNSLAVVGVEFALLLHKGYKAVTLTAAEKADKDRHF